MLFRTPTDTQAANRKLFHEGKEIPGFTNLFSQSYVSNPAGGGQVQTFYDPKTVAEKAYDLFGYETYDPENGISVLAPETQRWLENSITINRLDPASPY